jgi:Fungal specific transcription factor domain
MLCAFAMRLAEQKGLHQRPQKSWGLGPEEIAGRNRLFWVLYWLDKTISLRSGRPSVRPFPLLFAFIASHLLVF